MRKRRALIFDDQPVVLSVLKDFFEFRGYEVLAFPEPVICPIYEKCLPCPKAYPCGDIIVTDYRMPRVNGIDLLLQQHLHGCKLTNKNKVVLSGFLEEEERRRIEKLGCAFFAKPVDFDELARWVEECETRMDLSLPLGSRRREERYDSCREVNFKLLQSDEVLTGVAVNMSAAGLCLKSPHRLAREERIRIHADRPQTFLSALVRWVRPTSEGAYLAGCSTAPE